LLPRDIPPIIWNELWALVENRGTDRAAIEFSKSLPAGHDLEPSFWQAHREIPQDNATAVPRVVARGANIWWKMP
jgi:hypothetical protein